MRTLRWGWLASVALSVVACLAFAAPAGAAKPFTLDADEQAGKPDIAVDDEGTAHLAWNRYGLGFGDDTVVYCQVPRGKRACSNRRTLTAPLDTFSPPRVLLGDGGAVLVISSRCCVVEAGSPLYLFRSSDGGVSFSAPVQIGTNEISGDAELGPGEFSVSTITDSTTGGVRFQTAPLAPPAVTERPVLGEIPGEFGAAYHGSIAFVDPLTPIVAMDDLEKVYFRRFGGGTAYNSAAAWGPLKSVAKGDDPELAGLGSGKKGVHLLMKVGKPNQRRYVARRYNGSAFGPPTTVSEAGDPIFSSFFMDPSGRLGAIWVDNEKDAMRYRKSSNGKQWKTIQTLIGADRAGDVFNIRAEAARDGGGFAIYDGNNEGPVRAVPFGPTGPVSGGGGGECVDEVKLGGATVIAQEGCLQQDAKQKDRYTTGHDVRVNGIDLVVGGAAGSGAGASAAPKITLDKGERTLLSAGKVEARVGNVVLGRQALGWRLPAGEGQIRDLAGNPAEFNTGQFNVEFLGLKIVGYAVPKISGNQQVEIPVNVSLPAPFDSVLSSAATGNVTLRATNGGGLKLGGLKIRLENVSLGIALIKDFSIDYVGDPFLLQGKTDILLPPAGAELGVEFGLRNGTFDFGRGEFTFPPGSLAVSTDVLLRKIKFAVQQASSCDKPTKISGGVRFVTGPEVAGKSLIAVDGDVGYSFPRASCGTPGVLEISGTGELVGLPVAKLESRLTTDGQFTFKTDLEINVFVASVDASVKGGVDIPSKSFYAQGKAKLKAFGYSVGGVDTIVSSIGIGMCAPTPVPFTEFGFSYQWGKSLSADNFDAPPDCDVDTAKYKPAAFQRTSGAAASAAGSFRLPAGLRSVTARLSGAGGAPGFTLRRPTGAKVSYPGPAAGTVSGDDFVVVPVGERTFVKLVRPVAGTYGLNGAAGPAITGFAVARGLPNPSVKGKVRKGSGRSRRLAYRVRKIEGQAVMLVEQGKGVRNVLGRTRKARGVLRFRSASGPRGRRRILAIVTQDGAPRAQIAVARYFAPGPQLPGRPRNVRLRRRGSKLVVSWRRAPGAARHAVSYLLRDGRRQAKVTKRLRVVIGGVAGIDSGRIEVAGLRRDNVAGPSVRAKLRAKPKRRHHRPPRGRSGDG